MSNWTQDFNTKRLVTHRAVVPVYHESVRDAEGFLEPVEMVPATELHLECVLLGTFSYTNPKLAELRQKMRELVELFEETEKAEEEGPHVWPEGQGPHCVTELVPKSKVMKLSRLED
jgi:hypothetical protein